MTDTNRQTNNGKRQRVIHVINGELYSGAERVQDLLGHRLPERGFDVTFACVKPGRFDALRQHRESPVEALPMRRRVDMRPVRRLIAMMRESNTVLLHAHTPRSLMVARLAAMLTSVPLVYHVHSPTSRDTTRPLRNWLNSTVERFSLQGVQRLIAVSASLARHMQSEGVSPARIATVPNGVPVLDPPPARRPTPNGVWTIGTVALFRPRKGLETLLEAIAIVNRDTPRLRLRAVGPFESKEYATHIRGKAHELGIESCIEWAGFCQDVSNELRKLDLLVLPSLFGEGLPMVVLEAMAAGAPVVATRVEGVPEAIRDGIDGLLAEPGNPADLARVIQTVVTGQANWQQLRNSAIDRHRAAFSDHRMADQVAAVYRSILPVTPQTVEVGCVEPAAEHRATIDDLNGNR